MFKVGDKVVIVDFGGNKNHELNGTIGVIREIYNGSTYPYHVHHYDAYYYT